MKKLSYILVLILCCSSVSHAQLFVKKDVYSPADSLRGNLSAFRNCYDINYYHLDVKFDIEQKYISGSNLFQFTALSPINQLQFDLFANLKINHITYKGQKLPYRREYNAVFITFPQEIKKGSKDEFTVFYEGQPNVAKKAPMESGVVYARDSLGNPFVATACESKGASIWWPNKDHWSDEVDSMLISVSVPTALADVSNGRLRSITAFDNGYSRYDWFVSSPINNYNVAVNIGKYTHFHDTYQGEQGKLDLDYWVLPYHLTRAKIDFGRNVKPMLKTYEHWFGPYPFYQDGYKLVETPYPAMEHQSAISYGGYLPAGPGNELKAGKDGTTWDFIIVHESAHEWFGNNITAKDLADLWIHEAFATYAESLFLEAQHGKNVAQQYVFANRNGIANTSAIVAAYNVNQMGSGDMYSKGSTLLNTIRTIINDDEQWRQILRGLNHKYYHRTVTYDQVVDYISSRSGKNLKPIFNQYLLHPELPALVYKLIDGKLNYRWDAKEPNFEMPLLFTNENGKKEFAYPTSRFKPVQQNGESNKTIQTEDLDYYFAVKTNQ